MMSGSMVVVAGVMVVLVVVDRVEVVDSWQMIPVAFPTVV
jgi:hypothetical protein